MIKCEELTPLYEEIRYRYEVLVDTDVGEAFSLMRDSSSLITNYEQEVANLQKEYADWERTAKAFQASKSCELSKSVADGDRKSSFDEEVLEKWKLVSGIMKVQRYLESIVRFLNRVYFDSKLCYESCQRSMRYPVGDNRLGGHT